MKIVEKVIIIFMSKEEQEKIIKRLESLEYSVRELSEKVFYKNDPVWFNDEKEEDDN